ncbi:MULTISPECIES: DUF1345 domain-containing protein [Microbacterium]|jgi:uncharacterized membrane protein|uniref:DUF1345 domain-containing protein n=1 Tax=Microbacterium TaxID=33882 RepID=UPI000701E9C9|nr:MULTISPECIES: DUF1345 domain-containing protein [unclassified Microbacterium]MBN9199524.1 DUF1345 domain-containing protein [Microbacterium ginsengisoli]MCK9920203.1 DUF1345 domain-containing protein [Microbacteriaceae bacterium K1510]KQR90893.1 hypothetical protein ASF93_08140 [Microbacterium sp. Leaf347]KQS00098.1 hypothetical protein ASG00_11585 [Microbacterium sp. Leaf351]ODU76927.1 MAG: hypothetical protein ABT08_07975 [Microbacterium sp. SCN 71-21]
MADSRQLASVRVRAVVSIVAGLAGGIVVGLFQGWAAGILSAWAVLAIVQTTWVLVATWSMDAADTRAHATAEDPGRRTARLIAVVGSLVSLGAVGVVVVEARNASGWEALALAGISVVSVAASWLLIQVDYMLRVAHVYYTEPIGGIQFNQDEPPMYTDFAYFAFGLGMTYQVADTNVTTNEVRRIVIAQTMLAYLFGAVILATVINLVSSLG